MKRLALILSLMVALSCPVHAASEWHIDGKTWAGCDTEEHYSEFVRYVIQKDYEAAADMGGAGHCMPLKNGTVVYMEDSSMLSGIAQIRLKGKRLKLWTAIEAVKPGAK
jgi:hypothetical protein